MLLTITYCINPSQNRFLWKFQVGQANWLNPCCKGIAKIINNKIMQQTIILDKFLSDSRSIFIWHSPLKTVISWIYLTSCYRWNRVNDNHLMLLNLKSTKMTLLRVCFVGYCRLWAGNSWLKIKLTGLSCSIPITCGGSMESIFSVISWLPKVKRVHLLSIRNRFISKIHIR